MRKFVATDPIQIDLQRPQWITTAAGGRIQAGVVALGPQTFYFMPFKRRLTQEYHYNPQSFGEDKVEQVPYILIFARGTDIEAGDYFDLTSTVQLDDGRYVIEFVSPRNWDRGQAGLQFRG